MLWESYAESQFNLIYELVAYAYGYINNPNGLICHYIHPVPPHVAAVIQPPHSRRAYEHNSTIHNVK